MKRCRHCMSDKIAPARGLQGGGEVLIAIVLFLALMLPGVIYYIWKDGKPVCQSCGKRPW